MSCIICIWACICSFSRLTKAIHCLIINPSKLIRSEPWLCIILHLRSRLVLRNQFLTTLCLILSSSILLFICWNRLLLTSSFLLLIKFAIDRHPSDNHRLFNWASQVSHYMLLNFLNREHLIVALNIRVKFLILRNLFPWSRTPIFSFYLISKLFF